jgi:hypothetical protein
VPHRPFSVFSNVHGLPGADPIGEGQMIAET